MHWKSLCVSALALRRGHANLCHQHCAGAMLIAQSVLLPKGLALQAHASLACGEVLLLAAVVRRVLGEFPPDVDDVPLCAAKVANPDVLVPGVHGEALVAAMTDVADQRRCDSRRRDSTQTRETRQVAAHRKKVEGQTRGSSEGGRTPTTQPKLF